MRKIKLVLLWFALQHPGMAILLLTQDRIVAKATPSALRGAVSQLLRCVR